MNYLAKQKTLLGGLIGLLSITVVAGWHFYRFVTFRDAQGSVDAYGGLGHLWWAVLLFVSGCILAFVCLRVFLFDLKPQRHIAF